MKGDLDASEEITSCVDIFEDCYIHIKNVWLPSSRQVHNFGAKLTPRFRTIHFTDVHLVTRNP